MKRKFVCAACVAGVLIAAAVLLLISVYRINYYDVGNEVDVYTALCLSENSDLNASIIDIDRDLQQALKEADFYAYQKDEAAAMLKEMEKNDCTGCSYLVSTDEEQSDTEPSCLIFTLIYYDNQHYMFVRYTDNSKVRLLRQSYALYELSGSELTTVSMGEPVSITPYSTIINSNIGTIIGIFWPSTSAIIGVGVVAVTVIFVVFMLTKIKKSRQY